MQDRRGAGFTVPLSTALDIGWTGALAVWAVPAVLAVASGAAGLADPPASERLGLRGARAVARPAGMAGHALHDRSSSAGASRLHDPSHRASFGG